MQECWEQDQNARPKISKISFQLSDERVEKVWSESISYKDSLKKAKLKTRKDDAPRGKLALIFTDVQGSTSLWEHFPDEMSEALATHNDIIRGLLIRNKVSEEISFVALCETIFIFRFTIHKP